MIVGGTCRLFERRGVEERRGVCSGIDIIHSVYNSAIDTH